MKHLQLVNLIYRVFKKGLPIRETERDLDPFFQDEAAYPEEPLVVDANIGLSGKREKCVFWWSDDDGKRHLYELGPGCREDELMHPARWKVIFLGSVEELKRSKLAKRMQLLPPGEKETIAILVVRGYLLDLQGADMQDRFYLRVVITVIGSDERVYRPRPYISKEWQPAEDARDLPEEFCIF